MDSLLAGPSIPRVLHLSRTEILAAGGDSPQIYVRAVRDALVLHTRGETVLPLKPYLRWGSAERHIADRIIAMPAYIGGSEPIAGIKWIGSKHYNPSHYHLARASAITILNDPETNYPVAILEGGLISGMRTGAVTALAAQHLAQRGFSRVACVGCGPIARMQLYTLMDQFASIDTVLLYDSDTARLEQLGADLTRLYPRHSTVCAADAESAIRAAQVVVLCTTAAEPHVPFDWLNKGTFVSNVSLMDLHKDVFLRADKVVVDDWDQCNREGKLINQLVIEGLFSRAALHAELGQILDGQRSGRDSDEEIIVLNPMGLAIEDIACAFALYKRAVDAGIGTWMDYS